MPNLILKGTSDPLLQFWESGFSPSQGNSVSLEFKGTDINKITARAQEYSNLGYSGKIRFQYGIATLTVSCGGASGSVPGGVTPPQNRDIVDKWEVGVDQEKPDLFTNLRFLELMNAADIGEGVPVSQQIAQLARKVASGSNPTWHGFILSAASTKIVNNAGVELPSGITIADAITVYSLNPNLKYFVEDYLRGGTSYIHGKYVLRHSTSCPNNYSLNVADFNVEKIYSIAQLLTECQNPNLWIMPLPPYLAYKVANYPVPLYMPPNHAYGALKLRSNAVLAARDRIEISTEYMIDSCPVHTYGLI